MTETLHANIFFSITGIAVIVISILTIVLLVYAIKAFRDISHIADKVRKEGDAIVDDVRELRQNIEESSPLRTLASFFAQFVGNPRKRRPTRTKQDAE